MKFNAKYLSLLYFAIACGLAATAFFIFRFQKEKESTFLPIDNLENSFVDAHLNAIHVDSFQNIMQEIYAPFASVLRTQNKLTITLKGANQKRFSFFNGNQNLLKYKLSDFGFEIVMNESNQELTATFTITKNAVQVPNDILLRCTQLYSDLKPRQK